MTAEGLRPCHGGLRNTRVYARRLRKSAERDESKLMRGSFRCGANFQRPGDPEVRTSHRWSATGMEGIELGGAAGAASRYTRNAVQVCPVRRRSQLPLLACSVLVPLFRVLLRHRTRDRSTSAAAGPRVLYVPRPGRASAPPAPRRRWSLVLRARPEAAEEGDLLGKKLYVGNLAFTTTSDDLRELFGQYGTVTSAQVMTDRETGRSRGFGFVEMSDGADEAIRALNLTSFQGRGLNVNEAKPREDRPRSGGGGYGGRRDRY